jgi:hypothetical protein
MSLGEAVAGSQKGSTADDGVLAGAEDLGIPLWSRALRIGRVTVRDTLLRRPLAVPTIPGRRGP